MTTKSHDWFKSYGNVRWEISNKWILSRNEAFFCGLYKPKKKVDYELWGVFQWWSLIGLGSATNGTSLPSPYVFLLNFLVGAPTIVNNLLQKQI